MADRANTAAEKRYKQMTETPVPGLILKLAVPTVISMLVTAIYNAADTFFVGRISTEAIAAVGLAFSVMAVIQAFGFFCGQGSGSFLSRMLGGGKTKEAEEMAATGLCIAVLLGILTAVLVIINIRPISLFLGATENTLTDTENYIRIIVLGAPFMMGQFALNNQLRFQGSAIYAMYGLLAGAFINVVLDPLLIFTFSMGVRGAAIATISGQIISFFILLHGCSKGANIRLKLSNIRLTPYYIYEIINGGSASLFRQGLAALATALLNRAAGVYGDAAIAGMSVTTRVTMFVLSAMIGFGQGYQPVCAFNYGADKKDRVKEGYYFCLKLGFVFLLIMAVLCMFFAPEIIGFFRNDPEVIKVGAASLRYQAVSLPLLPFIIITNMLLQAIGKGLKASITSAARNGLFFVPLIVILPRFLGLTGVEATQAVADVFSLLLALPMAYSEIRKM
ncbi:MAG: MATE family efflux transporter [Lachnospiraceae bacterium]|nr:MATE family efflux transporter [Lachnospiraceae bacterium]